MRSLPLGPILCLSLALMGCQEPLEAVPRHRPRRSGRPSCPAGGVAALLQPGRKSPQGAGTAFVVRDEAGRPLMLTAAHVLEGDPGWPSAREAYLKVMAGPVVAKTQGRPLHVGRAFSAADASKDLVIWPLLAGPRVTSLKLAAADPRKNEWVWVVGQESSSKGSQTTYLCQVIGARNRGLMLEQHDTVRDAGVQRGPGGEREGRGGREPAGGAVAVCPDLAGEQHPVPAGGGEGLAAGGRCGHEAPGPVTREPILSRYRIDGGSRPSPATLARPRMRPGRAASSSPLAPPRGAQHHRRRSKLGLTSDGEDDDEPTRGSVHLLRPRPSCTPSSPPPPAPSAGRVARGDPAPAPFGPIRSRSSPGRVAVGDPVGQVPEEGGAFVHDALAGLPPAGPVPRIRLELAGDEFEIHVMRVRQA